MRQSRNVCESADGCFNEARCTDIADLVVHNDRTKRGFEKEKTFSLRYSAGSISADIDPCERGSRQSAP